MHFFKGLYHVYNRGNNRQRIFFRPGNYIYFLGKVKKYLVPRCDILAWCLMPNHFHFLIHADERTSATRTIAGDERNVLSEGIRNLLSSYSQAINRQNNTTGSLFQQNTKSKPIFKDDNRYDLICFNYIHQNPLKASLAKKMEDWEHSSFKDYCDLGTESLCNRELAIQLLGLNMQSFYEDSYRSIADNDLRNILLIKSFAVLDQTCRGFKQVKRVTH